MKITFSNLLNITLAIALVSSLLFLNITHANQYDPWADYNGDGIINIKDASPVGAG